MVVVFCRDGTHTATACLAARNRGIRSVRGAMCRPITPTPPPPPGEVVSLREVVRGGGRLSGVRIRPKLSGDNFRGEVAITPAPPLPSFPRREKPAVVQQSHRSVGRSIVGPVNHLLFRLIRRSGRPRLSVSRRVCQSPKTVEPNGSFGPRPGSRATKKMGFRK